MELSKNEWKVLFSLARQPNKVALKLCEAELVGLIKKGLVSPDYASLISRSLSPFTEAGVKLSKDLLARTLPLLGGIPFNQKKVDKSEDVFAVLDGWKRIKLKSGWTYVTPDNGVLFLGRKPRDDIKAQNATPKEATTARKGVTALLRIKSWEPVVPYAFQLYDFLDTEMVILKGERSKFKVPIAAKYYDLFSKRYTNASWFGSERKKPHPIIVKGKGSRKGFDGILAVIMPMRPKGGSTVWVPPDFSDKD